jgi:hypothetical protein
VFRDFIELFKSPAISALISAITATLSAPLTQRLNRRAAELQWLRERRGQAYADLLSLDLLGRVLMRVSANPSPENRQDFRTASEQSLHARSSAGLYAPKTVSALLDRADLVVILNAGNPNQCLAGTQALAAIRAQIVECARNQIDSAT